MNKIGNMAGAGALIVLFVGVIVALSLYSGGIAENIGTVTQTRGVVNYSFTFPANTSSVVLPGQAATSVVVINSTDGVSIPASNYTITNYDLTTGTFRVLLTAKASTFSGLGAKVSYTQEPLGYSTDSSARSMVGLIGIFAALGVVAFVIWRVYEDGMDWFK